MFPVCDVNYLGGPSTPINTIRYCDEIIQRNPQAANGMFQIGVNGQMMIIYCEFNLNNFNWVVSILCSQHLYYNGNTASFFKSQ